MLEHRQRCLLYLFVCPTDLKNGTMVRSCAFPSCVNKMSRNTPLSFHRLPLSDGHTLRLWLAVLQMDANTPVQTLRRADLRVCSQHFDREDYCQPKKRRNPIPKHFFLKKEAVPREEIPAAHTLQVIIIIIIIKIQLLCSSDSTHSIRQCVHYIH